MKPHPSEIGIASKLNEPRHNELIISNYFLRDFKVLILNQLLFADAPV